MEKAIEIFKNALELEVQAELFYEKAAEMTTDDESRMVFLELTDMEDGHAHRIVERFKDTDFGKLFDADAWLQELEEETAKNLPLEANELVTSGNMRAVLDFALKMEEDARDSYQHLAEIFTDPDDKAYCTDLANEEQEHINAIMQLRQSLDMDVEERPDL
jgi:rubrerythrin